MSWQVAYTKQAQKDAKKLAASDMKPKAQKLLSVIAENPYPNPPPYEKLVGNLAGAYSRRINRACPKNTFFPNQHAGQNCPFAKSTAH